MSAPSETLPKWALQQFEIQYLLASNHWETLQSIGYYDVRKVPDLFKGWEGKNMNSRTFFEGIVLAAYARSLICTCDYPDTDVFQTRLVRIVPGEDPVIVISNHLLTGILQ